VLLAFLLFSCSPCLAFDPSRTESRTTLDGIESQQQVLQNISDTILQERLRNQSVAKQEKDEDKPSVIILNPNFQQNISWDTSILPKQHSDTFTTTSTCGLLATRDPLSLGIFFSYIYGTTKYHYAQETRQDSSTYSASFTINYSPYSNLYLSLTPSIAVRDVDETYFTDDLVEMRRSYSSLDTSLTPEIGYTINLNDHVSVTPSLSALFSWSKYSGLYHSSSSYSSVVPAIRSFVTINKYVSMNAGAYCQYMYERPEADNHDDNKNAIGRYSWDFNIGVQVNPTEKLNLSLTLGHSVYDKGWGNNLTAYVSYSF